MILCYGRNYGRNSQRRHTHTHKGEHTNSTQIFLGLRHKPSCTGTTALTTELAQHLISSVINTWKIWELEASVVLLIVYLLFLKAKLLFSLFCEAKQLSVLSQYYLSYKATRMCYVNVVYQVPFISRIALFQFSVFKPWRPLCDTHTKIHASVFPEIPFCIIFFFHECFWECFLYCHA